MPWLAELVEASEESLDMLPVQCLCEFLLHDPRETTLSEHGDDDSSRLERQRQKTVIISLKMKLLLDLCFHPFPCQVIWVKGKKMKGSSVVMMDCT